ncbi:MAG: 16S rRNA (cytosine(1402)-N(4))-methyltransferase RsmH [Dehalococcoidia bacterium]|nr:MAG: 16S rRNA (cytosine(1402)-N(4))-methyltransferase RsmH [Dehalococcoidia bacterium]
MSSERAPQHDPRHEPVMLHEVVEALAVRPGGRYVDATVGLGGHARAIIEAAQPGGQLLGIDRDPQALAIATERLMSYGDAVVLVRGEFAEVARICTERGFTPVDGVLIDAGVSSFQLDTPGRGFSFRRDEPLDMRMDPDGPVTAADIVNTSDETDLAAIIFEYGEERRSRRIAREIVARRPLRTTSDLARAVEAAVGRRGQDRIHPATLTFQALRIAVNNELDQLESALEAAHTLLTPGGRLAVISFHSLEDRMVKQFIREHTRDCICPPRQPVCTCAHRATLRDAAKGGRTASDDEIARNPRARSARLRAAERLEKAA